MGSDESPVDSDSIKLARDVYEVASRHLLQVGCDPYAVGPEFDTSDTSTFAGLRLLRRGNDATGALLKLPPPWRNVNPDGTVRTRIEGRCAYEESPGCVTDDFITLGSIGVVFMLSRSDPRDFEREERIARSILPEGSEEDARQVLSDAEFQAFCRRGGRAEAARFWAAAARDHGGSVDIEALRSFFSELKAGTRMGLWVAEFGKPVLAAVLAHDAGDGRALRSLLAGDLSRETTLDVATILDRLVVLPRTESGEPASPRNERPAEAVSYSPNPATVTTSTDAGRAVPPPLELKLAVQPATGESCGRDHLDVAEPVETRELAENCATALAILCEVKWPGGLTESQLGTKMAAWGCPVAEGTVRRHVTPPLAAMGLVENKRPKGYRIIEGVLERAHHIVSRHRVRRPPKAD